MVTQHQLKLQQCAIACKLNSDCAYRALDAGINPDTSTAGLFKQGLQANQAAKGKVEVLTAFRQVSSCLTNRLDPLE